jgi:hypothetical protein
MNPAEQARHHAEQARGKLDGVEREAGGIAEAHPYGLPPEMAANLTDRWSNSIAAAQAHAMLAMVGMLNVIAYPLRTVGNADAPAEVWVPTRADERIEWQWWQDAGEMGGEWVDAYSETDANLCADNHGTKVRSRVVGPWTERLAR